MPALAELITAHAPLLLLDTASARVQVGLYETESNVRWAVADEDAGTGVFRCLAELGAEPASVRAFIFCEGPGSVLGIRTAAMVLRTWAALEARPLFAYRSLEVVARSLGRKGLSVIADARRDTWHCLTLADDGNPGPLNRVPTAELTGPLVMPEGFRHWSALPAGVERTPYCLETLLPAVTHLDLFRPTSDPDAFLHQEPVYATWTPHIHRAPGTP